jgi:SpoVK/Ycf46/Vps4 family AAA+-type ATPase
MSHLVKYLDNNYKQKKYIKFNKYNIIENNKLSKCQFYNLLYAYNLEFNKYINNQYINIYLKHIEKKRIFIIDKIPYTITTKINNIKDLINIIENYSNIVNISDNIKITTLIKIKEPLIQLDNLIGMHDLKNDILNQILFYIQNLHLQNGIEYMHTVLCGPPGTGKTEVAKIIGLIFCKLNILSKNTFTKVVRSDLIAGYLGQTAIKTKKVIEDSLGGVLFIDEAYSLGNAEKRDSFAKECIDTICESLSNHKHELMVIIAGYEKELDECFFNFNPGLRSRFPWVFKTDKYSPNDLLQIFSKKVNDNKWSMDNSIDESFFIKNIKYFTYYGRDIETFLSKTKIAHARRVFTLPDNYKTIITKTDLDNGLKLFIKHSYKEDNSIQFINHLYN